MRRDLVRWFLLGMAFSAVIVGVVMLLGQSVQTATVTLLSFYLFILFGVMFRRYQQRAWQRRYGLSHGENFYSHEMRCPGSRKLRHVRVSTIAGRSHRAGRSSH